ncbi:sel1 repeat family protein [Campylobacter sp. RM12642]|uniref:tetratricopeptide repeat protein n=1 Tax=unclassified Campylobacter TaxID=2593542 RepID=UPI001BD94161|nr:MULTISPECIES: tetratricopeptide repeat protein [unclassified Campylobacter]MBT0878196.1 sel1 repeat family protein [Campylobacter sp. 2018MI01]MBZ7979380.1 sel1 repeat family protein [Campylobacter sp. RM12642]ULO04162.1 hypothetical protein AVBRAN_1718 [Campylobacter sp. RM12651]
MKKILLIALISVIAFSQDYYKEALKYHKCLGVECDLEKAKELYIISCNEKSYKACNNLATIYNEENNPDSLQKAEYYYKLSCEYNNNDGISCGNLGIFYSNTLKDDIKAEPYLFKGCKANIKDACMQLAFVYINTNTNLDRTAKIFEHYCKLNDQNSCFNLGQLYLYNDKMKNEKLGFENHLKACNMDNAISCKNIAILYVKHNNLFKAFKYFKKSCGLGEQEDCKKALSIVIHFIKNLKN